MHRSRPNAALVGAGSPAIDTALAANCPATDQRSVTRPIGPTCDSGAFEAAAAPPIWAAAIPTLADWALAMLAALLAAIGWRFRASF